MITKARIPFILLAAICLCIAAATAVDARWGLDTAYGCVYGSVWFKLLWCAAATTGLMLILKRRMWHDIPVFILHSSFVIILVGAFVTSVSSDREDLHLRQGVPSVSLPFVLRVDSFMVDYYPDGDAVYDYRCECSMYDADGEGGGVIISMNNILSHKGYRIYLSSYDPDLLGVYFTVNHDPYGTPITYFGYVVLAVGVLWCVMRQLNRRMRLAAVVFLILLSVASFLRWKYAMVIPVSMPVLRSPLLVVHVGIIVVAYVLYAVAAIRPNHSLVLVATMFLAAGIFLGAVWAGQSWGGYWSWDPKESWALITMIVYALSLHRQSLPMFQNGKFYNLYVRLAFLVLLMTYLGVNYLLAGLHSYA